MLVRSIMLATKSKQLSHDLSLFDRFVFSTITLILIEINLSYILVHICPDVINILSCFIYPQYNILYYICPAQSHNRRLIYTYFYIQRNHIIDNTHYQFF